MSDNEFTDSEQTPIGIDDAVNSLMGKLHGSTPDATTVQGEEDEGEEQPVSEGSDPDEEVEEDESEVDETDDEDPDETDKSEEEEETADDFAFTITDEEGKEVGVSKDEAKAGYLRFQDYTRKTQEVSKERGEVKTLKGELTEQKVQAARLLEQIEMAADRDLSKFVGIDWAKLQQEDPYTYEEKAQEYDALMRQRQVANQQKQAIIDDYTKEYQAAYEEFRQEELGKLKLADQSFEADPAAKRSEILAQVSAKYGFDAEELEGFLDHRAILVMRDALKMHELQGKLKTGDKKKETVTKHLKPSSSKSSEEVRSEHKEAARKRAMKSHTIEDALNFLETSRKGN